MSSKVQLNEYVKRLKGQMAEHRKYIQNLEITIVNDNRIIRNLRNTIKEKNSQIESLRDTLKKSKRWYQIILKIKSWKSILYFKILCLSLLCDSVMKKLNPISFTLPFNGIFRDWIAFVDDMGILLWRKFGKTLKVLRIYIKLATTAESRAWKEKSYIKTEGVL